MTVSSQPPPLRVLRPPGRWFSLSPRELWLYRGLLSRFAARDLTLRYRQTLLGMIWVVLQPLLGAGALTFVFGAVGGLKGPNGVPLIIVSFAGMTAWNLFANLALRSGSSLVGNAAMIQKIFFPRLILPMSSVLSGLVDLAVSLVVLAVMLAINGTWAGAALVTLPLWFALLALPGLGLGALAGALSVRYRDIQYVLPVVLQFLPFVSPVGFTLANAPHGLRWLVLVNPLTGLLEAVRWATIGTPFPPARILAYSVVGSLLIFFAGIALFDRLERQFADVI